jgi:uncharacterized DUF497 family protein
VVVSYTYRGRAVRLISARFATEDETELYYQEFFGEPL